MRTLLAASALAALAFAGACSSKSSRLSTDDARDMLIDRNWIDRMPETNKDRLHVYRFVPTMGGGVFQDRTIFKGSFELFMFKVDRDRIVFDLPETQQHVTSPFRIESVDGPAPFDLKLTITDDPRGPKTYYGMRAEKDLDGRALETRLAGTR